MQGPQLLPFVLRYRLAYDAPLVREVLDTILNEEWWHRQFAERDLDALDATRR